MVIQRLDSCVSCSQTLPPKTCAWWDSSEGTATCTACRPTGMWTPRSPRTASRSVAQTSRRAGSVSALQEYERRVAKLRRQPGVIFGEKVVGDVGARLVDEPPAASSQAMDAGDERDLAVFLDREVGNVSTVLHDRRVSKVRGNIDHLVVASTGIWVIDAKDYSGKVECRNMGGRQTPDPRLFVAHRNQTKLVAGLIERARSVERAIEALGVTNVPVRPCLCFTGADWRFRSKPFSIDGVWIGWPQALAKTLRVTPILERSTVATLANHLGAEFPPSD